VVTAAPQDPRPARAPDDAAAAALRAAERATSRVAPVWPLDRLIATSPLWERVDAPIERVAAELEALAGARLTMPRAYYREALREGRFHRAHVRAAIAELGAPLDEADVMAALEADEPSTRRLALVVDAADAALPRADGASWRDAVVDATSRLCASVLDEGQAILGRAGRPGLFATWRRRMLAERGASSARLSTAADELPATAEELVPRALDALEIAAPDRPRYLEALILDVLGWASWCAYLAAQPGGSREPLRDLLAIRLGWELVLLRAGGDDVARAFRRAKAGWAGLEDAALEARRADWVLQRALEIALHRRGGAALVAAPREGVEEAPVVDLVFCIDVRAEPVRRALEAAAPGLRTRGFAGFFGLAAEYVSAGVDAARPQLPGPIAPRVRVTDEGVPAAVAARRRSRLLAADAWARAAARPLTSFGVVESLGLGFAAGLVRDALGLGDARADRADRAGLDAVDHARRAPTLTSHVDGAPIALEERVAIAESILRGMSLVVTFAPIVVIVGHASSTRNNPHAGALDCGACSGNSGEVNARAAAALLEEPAVREGLARRGIDVPRATRFVAAVHDTTTDELELLDTRGCDPRALARLRVALAEASRRARRERAERLGLGDLDDARLRDAAFARARDVSEVRPEWGLAGNAALVLAPRERTRHVDLGGRAFLHEYACELDADFRVLEALLTAPLVVAHLINLQYYASTVDPRRFGSGDKTLHDVVGGRIGVFEGSGGDLRVGLPLQCLHDGARWVHEPLRLAVYVDAPRAAIDGVIAKHERLRHLVEHGFVFLHRIDATRGVIEAWTPAGFRAEGEATR
jgi:hypothetical protein